MHNTAAAMANTKEQTRVTVTFWQGLIVAAISIIVSLVTIGASWATFQDRLATVERENANIQMKLEKIQDRMVDKDLFNETRQDVKDLLKRK